MTDIVTMIVISNTTDHKLQDKLREQPKPTWTSVESASNAHTKSRNEGSKTKDKVRKAKETPKKGGGSQGSQATQQGKGKQPSKKSDYLEKLKKFLPGVCYKCGDAKHMADKCTMPASTICDKCKKTGHVGKVCITNFREQQQGKQGARRAAEDRMQDEEDDYAQSMEERANAVQEREPTPILWA